LAGLAATILFCFCVPELLLLRLFPTEAGFEVCELPGFAAATLLLFASFEELEDFSELALLDCLDEDSERSCSCLAATALSFLLSDVLLEVLLFEEFDLPPEPEPGFLSWAKEAEAAKIRHIAINKAFFILILLKAFSY
jgi:hypothetical protein